MVNIGGTNTGNERRGLSFLVFVGIIGFSIARAIATFFTNYLWFDSVDLNSVWIKILLTKSILVAATSLLAFAFIFINLRLAVRATPVMDIFESFESQDPLTDLENFLMSVSLNIDFGVQLVFLYSLVLALHNYGNRFYYSLIKNLLELQTQSFNMMYQVMFLDYLCIGFLFLGDFN